MKVTLHRLCCTSETTFSRAAGLTLMAPISSFSRSSCTPILVPAVTYLCLVAMSFQVPRVPWFQLPRKPWPYRISGRASVTVDGTVKMDATGKVVQQGERAWALSARCTHLGCAVVVAEDGQTLSCPCHGSRYTLDGQVLRGPATDPLPRLSHTLAEDGSHVVERT